MKKVCMFLSFLLALSLIFGMTSFAAADPDREAYLANYETYTVLYASEYVPVYDEFHDLLKDLSKLIDKKKMTESKFTESKELYAYLTQVNDEFFGDRKTKGTSRYDVPAVREAMKKAAASKSYVKANALCDELKELINARIDFLTKCNNKIIEFISGDQEPEKPVEDPKITKAKTDALALCKALNTYNSLVTEGYIVHQWNIPMSAETKKLELAVGDTDLSISYDSYEQGMRAIANIWYNNAVGKWELKDEMYILSGMPAEDLLYDNNPVHVKTDPKVTAAKEDATNLSAALNEFNSLVTEGYIVHQWNIPISADTAKLVLTVGDNDLSISYDSYEQGMRAIANIWFNGSANKWELKNEMYSIEGMPEESLLYENSPTH